MNDHKLRLTFIKQTVFGWRKRATNERVYSMGLYQCECGNIKELSIAEVKRGKVKSCGCLAKEQQKKSVTKHGLWNTPLYNIWVDIKNRCYKKRHHAYMQYGGRGVRMCDEWLNDVSAFCNWCLNNGWEHGLHVDKDKKGEGILYSPETCSIITAQENYKIKRSNKYITYNGETKYLADWARSVNMNIATFCSRLDSGWSIELALTKPIRKIK